MHRTRRSRRHSSAGACALSLVLPLVFLAGRADAQANAAARDASVAPASDDPLRTLLARTVMAPGDSQPARHPFLDEISPGDTVIRTTIAPELGAAIEAAVPSWRLRNPGPSSIRLADHALMLPVPGFSIATIDAAVADLDRDGRLEAVLVGYEMAKGRPLADSIFHPTEPAGPDGLAPKVGPGTMFPVVVLGVRTRRGANGAVHYEVTTLARDSAAVYGANELPKETPPILRPLVTNDARGQKPADVLKVRAALRRAHRFVRYQDDECFGDGAQWTVRAGKWLRVPAFCTIDD